MNVRKLTPCALIARARALRKANIELNPRYPELQDVNYYNSPRQFQLDSRADWPMQQQVMIDFAYDLFRWLRKNHLPAYVHTAHRTRALQAELKRQGHSQVEDGPHNRGCALDIVHAYYNWNVDKKFWEVIGQQGKEIIRAKAYPIVWGGDFKSLYDPAHWQVKDWRRYPRVSDASLFDQKTGEVIQWKRSPFNREIARPTLSSGEDYYQYLERTGRKWRTERPKIN